MQNINKAFLGIIKWLLENKYIVILAVVLMYGLFLRIDYLYPHYLSSDLYRDYLIADHIVSYGEWPQIGPYNSLFGRVAPPLYYYLAAFFLLFGNDILSLMIANILIQITVLFLLYLFAKNLFSSPKIALGVVLLSSFSNVVLRQASFFSQAYEASLFVHLGFLFGALFYKSRSNKYLILTTLCLITAAILHSSAVALFPCLGLLILLAYRKYIVGFAYSKSLIALLSGFLILFIEFNDLVLPSLKSKLVSSVTDFIANLFGNTIFFFATLFPFFSESEKFVSTNTFVPVKSLASEIMAIFLANPWAIKNMMGLLLFISSLMLLFISIIKEKDPVHKRIMHFLGFAAATYLSVMSLFIMHEKGFYHFVPLYSLYFILLAKAIFSLRFEFIKWPLIVIFSIVFMSNPAFFKITHNRFAFTDPLQGLSQAIAENINSVKKKEGFDSYHFFNITEYIKWTNSEQLISRAIYWSRIEKIYREKMVKIEDASVGTFAPISEKIKYEYVICKLPQVRTCIEYYEVHGQGKIENEIFADSTYIVFVAKY